MDQTSHVPVSRSCQSIYTHVHGAGAWIRLVMCCQSIYTHMEPALGIFVFLIPGTLNLFSKYNGGEEKLLWTSTGTHGNRWHRETVTLTSQKYQLIFEALRDGSVGHIAIDDITVMSGSCAPPTRCSFEAGSCGFSSEGTNKWNLHRNLPFNQQPGPSHDHTLQSFSGHYMVVDTSSKKSALLTSSVYSAHPDQGCLNFWYQMGGANPGTLIVYMEEDTGKKKKKEILRISGAKPGSWRHGQAAIQAQGQWKLLLEAVGAGGDRSYIAVDDIHINHHRCHESVSCDFERGPCSWTNVRIPLIDTYDWDWTDGAATNRPSSTPDKDRNLGSSEGHYVFVDTGAMHTEGSSAWLISDHLPETTGSCFTFSHRTDSADHFRKGNSGEIWAIVIGVIIAVLCLVLVFLLYRRWKRNVQNSPGLPDQEDQIDGFDNVVYDTDPSES
ncbi:hypothetical protein GDO81_015309 [Engystomops pustulosus]|uniref:MAM domain-containing protein n=1 Tax=Engystomops pustulosus TaxID=76066 RepID=A0AAV7APB5_ENGPU|nr:hypothetical protein GDO81_015309 [Engystomops pustulosus]